MQELELCILAAAKFMMIQSADDSTINNAFQIQQSAVKLQVDCQSASNAELLGGVRQKTKMYLKAGRKWENSSNHSASTWCWVEWITV